MYASGSFGIVAAISGVNYGGGKSAGEHKLLIRLIHDGADSFFVAEESVFHPIQRVSETGSNPQRRLPGHQ